LKIAFFVFAFFLRRQGVLVQDRRSFCFSIFLFCFNFFFPEESFQQFT
jgi:hypothetical protein